MLNGFDLAGLIGIPVGTAKYIVSLVNSGLSVASVISIAMSVLGGGGMVTASLIYGIKKKLYKQGATKAAIW